MTSTLAGWVRSAFAPRTRLLPGIGARLARHPGTAARVLRLLRRVPGAPQYVSRPLIERMAIRVVSPVAGGARMELDLTEPMGRALATRGVWEPHVTALFRRLLEPNDICVDVGANTGYYSLLAARIVGPGGRVYAIEPAPGPYSMLVKNVELNRFRNVTSLQVAAGAASGHALLDAGSGGSDIRSAVIAPDVADNVPAALRVPMTDVSAVVAPAELARLRLVKIDVEGYEAEVLRGLVPLYQRGARPSILVELHPGAVEPSVEILVGLARADDLGLYDVRADGSLAEVSGSSPEHLVETLERRYERHLLLSPESDRAVRGR